MDIYTEHSIREIRSREIRSREIRRQTSAYHVAFPFLWDFLLAYIPGDKRLWYMELKERIVYKDYEIRYYYIPTVERTGIDAVQPRPDMGIPP